MKALCKRYNLQCHFTEAIYGKELNEETLMNIYDKDEAILEHTCELSKGEIGCALSHLNIYKKMIDKNIKKAIIFEDDIQIEKDFSSVINNINHFPKNWDLVLLGYYSNHITEKRTKASLRYRKKITNTHSTVRLIEIANGTHGYIIHMRGAKKLIRELSTIKKPIDFYTGNDKYINLYAMLPRVIRLDNLYSKQSTIEPERLQKEVIDYKNHISTRNKVSTIYKIKKEIIRPFNQIISKTKNYFDYVKNLQKYT